MTAACSGWTEQQVRGYLELLGALFRASHGGKPSRLTVEEWDALLAVLPPRERTAVVRVCIAGDTQTDLAREWEVSRTRVEQILFKGLRRLRRVAGRLR